MKIEAVTVCVQFSDYLAWTIQSNRNLFSKWIIVTDKKDHKTKRICDYYGVTCVQTDAFYENGSTFNKYAGINEGLKHVSDNAWVLFLDGDIVLPPLTKRVLEELTLDPKCLYGIDRLNCRGIEKWVEYCNNPNLIIDNWLMTNAGLEFGARINHYYGQWGDGGKFGGWKPLGYFQLTHRSSFDKYPQECNGADHCDMVFCNQWKREQRVMIPELMGIHIESTDSKWGNDWWGRTSAPFKFEPTVKLDWSVLEADYPHENWFIRLIKRLLCWLGWKRFCKKNR